MGRLQRHQLPLMWVNLVDPLAFHSNVASQWGMRGIRSAVRLAASFPFPSRLAGVKMFREAGGSSFFASAPATSTHRPVFLQDNRYLWGTFRNWKVGRMQEGGKGG